MLIYLVAGYGEEIGDRIHAHFTHSCHTRGNQLVLTFTDPRLIRIVGCSPCTALWMTLSHSNPSHPDIRRDTGAAPSPSPPASTPPHTDATSANPRLSDQPFGRGGTSGIALACP
jgi:hypothetical protein